MRNGGGICDIDGLMEDSLPGGIVNVCGGLFNLGCSARANRDICAFARELFRDSTAKSPASRRHDGYAAL